MWWEVGMVVMGLFFFLDTTYLTLGDVPQVVLCNRQHTKKSIQ